MEMGVKGEFNFAFVYHNWSAQELERLLGAPAPCKHVGAGEETCPTTGTPHLQCCMHLGQAKTWSAMRKWLTELVGRPPNDLGDCHAKYTTNVAYCKKGEQPRDEWDAPGGGTSGPNYGKNARYHERGAYVTKREQGENQRQAAKRNLEAASEGRWDEVDEDIIAYRLPSFQNGVRFYRSLRYGKPARLTGCPADHNEWHWGVAGAGKTQYCRYLEDSGAYLLPLEDKPWTAYNNEDVVVIADMDESHAHMLRDIKIWADLDPFHARILYGTLHIRPKRIVVTANCAPEVLFARWAPEHVRAILRRFRVYEWTQPYYLDEATKELNPDWSPPRALALPEALSGVPEQEIDEPGPDWSENWCA